MDIKSLEYFVFIFGIGEDKKYTCLKLKEEKDKIALLKLIQKRLEEESRVS